MSYLSENSIFSSYYPFISFFVNFEFFDYLKN